MAGNKKVLVRFAVLCTIAIAGVLAAPAALAQVPALPPTPSAPPLPQPVIDAISQSEDLLIPVMVDTTTQAEPGVNGVGFALRPGCAAFPLALALLYIASSSLPTTPAPAPVMKPVFVACGFASVDGPADPVFRQVDSAAGPQLEGAVQPVLGQIGDGLAPARPNLFEVCGDLTLLGGAQTKVPPPLSRFDMTGTVCGD